MNWLELFMTADTIHRKIACSKK